MTNLTTKENFEAINTFSEAEITSRVCQNEEWVQYGELNGEDVAIYWEFSEDQQHENPDDYDFSFENVSKIEAY